MKILWQLLFPTRCPVCDSIVKPFGEKICLECLPEASRGNSALVYEMWQKDTGRRRILQRLPPETAYV